MLDGGRSGVLVPSGDTRALTDGILRVVSDPRERSRLADAAATRVRDFEPRLTALRWERLFGEPPTLEVCPSVGPRTKVQSPGRALSVTLTHTRRTAGRGAGTREVSGRIRYLLLNAYARGGTVRTTLSMANLLAERGHDVEVASLVEHRPRAALPGAPPRSGWSRSPVPARAGPRPGTVDNAVRWAGEVALRGTRSRLAHPRDRRCGRPDPRPRPPAPYVQAQDDCVVVATRLTLELALAGLRTDRHVAVAQEHNHLSRHPDVRQDYGGALPRARRGDRAHRG